MTLNTGIDAHERGVIFDALLHVYARPKPNMNALDADILEKKENRLSRVRGSWG
jgi:hypothetical protein